MYLHVHIRFDSSSPTRLLYNLIVILNSSSIAMPSSLYSPIPPSTPLYPLLPSTTLYSTLSSTLSTSFLLHPVSYFFSALAMACRPRFSRNSYGMYERAWRGQGLEGSAQGFLPYIKTVVCYAFISSLLFLLLIYLSYIYLYYISYIIYHPLSVLYSVHLSTIVLSIVWTS